MARPRLSSLTDKEMKLELYRRRISKVTKRPSPGFRKRYTVSPAVGNLGYEIAVIHEASLRYLGIGLAGKHVTVTGEEDERGTRWLRVELEKTD